MVELFVYYVVVGVVFAEFVVELFVYFVVVEVFVVVSDFEEVVVDKFVVDFDIDGGDEMDFGYIFVDLLVCFVGHKLVD